MELQDRIALVTGASRGIGRAVAVELARRGCHVAFTYRASEAEALGLAAEIEQAGRRAVAFQADAADFAAMQRVGQEVKSRLGPVELLVSNAGITRDRQLVMMSEADWDDVLDVNLKGAFNAAKAVVYGMMKRRAGRILNISSVSGFIGQRGQANYAASKAGLVGLTRSLAKELAPFGLTVNALALGFIETDMTAQLSEEQRARNLEHIPLQRFGTVQEVARMAAFLLGDGAAYVTGQTLVMDGGLTI